LSVYSAKFKTYSQLLSQSWRECITSNLSTFSGKKKAVIH
jgi:hypothetical protein